MADTIRGRIVIAFSFMCLIAGALGGYATVHIREAGDLAARTFDQSLMSIDYARAASADFAAMQAAFARRWIATDPVARQTLDARIDELRQSLSEDLTIATERSQSTRAGQAAGRAEEAASAWDGLRAQVSGAGNSPEAWNALEAQASTVDQQIDLLVNYTAGDGFTYRQSARAIVANDIRINLACTALVVVFAAGIAWLLARQIIGPVAAASAFAKRIAQGQLDGTMPAGGGDELGGLLVAMGTMRDNLRVMMEREVDQRRSAQARLADALESSREGIVVIDAAGRVALANAQASGYLAVAPALLDRDAPRLAAPAGDERPDEEAAPTATLETRLRDGRWLRVSRNDTRDGGSVAVFSDISVLKEQEETLKATNLRLDAALENMSQGLCLYDAEGRLKVVNRQFCEIYRLDAADVRPGMAFVDVLRLKVAAGNYTGKAAANYIAGRLGKVARGSAEIMFEELAHGRVVAIAHQPTKDGGWVATYEDVTERRHAEAQIVFMARHDALTNLPNRLMFEERIEQAIAQAGRGKGFAVLCLDLDRFKQVNDTLGHPVGDGLLRVVAERLQACVRDVDTVARLGGDEFAIVQCDVEKAEDPIVLARRIVEAVSQPVEIDNHRVPVGVSIGISVAPGDGLTSAKLLKNADAALYRAKADGRGTWRCFEPAMDARLQARRALELDLRQALADDGFELYFQPIYDLARDRIGGFEALLRWHHPARGSVLPADFIPVAEEIGLIIPLGEWVLRKACEEARRWPAHIKVAVNVSPAQFKSPRLVLAITEALTRSGLTPNRLELEITETVLLANSTATLDTLHLLRGFGLRFSMDDFGTGYSSLSYLRSFPFDKIKIDQSFIRDLATTEDSGVIVRAITGLGSSLGMQTTAEGVETAEQIARLRAAGCDEVQGYYFSPPVPAHGIPALLERWNGVATAA